MQHTREGASHLAVLLAIVAAVVVSGVLARHQNGIKRSSARVGIAKTKTKKKERENKRPRSVCHPHMFYRLICCPFGPAAKRQQPTANTDHASS